TRPKMRTRSRTLRSAIAIAIAVLLGSSVAPAQEVGLVGVGRSDAPVIDALEASIEGTRRHRLEAVGRPSVLWDQVRRWSERFVVVVDTAQATVEVVRPEDGTVISRVLDPTAARSAPHAVALAAAELLELAREAPLARAAAVGAGADSSPSPS